LLQKTFPYKTAQHFPDPSSIGQRVLIIAVPDLQENKAFYFNLPNLNKMKPTRCHQSAQGPNFDMLNVSLGSANRLIDARAATRGSGFLTAPMSM